MLESALLEIHFPPLGRTHDCLILDKHIVFNMNAKITAYEHNGAAR